MSDKSILIAVVFQLTFFVSPSFHENPSDDHTCGQEKPDITKTCISIKLPWSAQTLYFCTEKSQFKYRSNCQNHLISNCNTKGMKGSLILYTPWECCPEILQPDSCVDQQCPLAPYNRKCETIQPRDCADTQCCPSYFCEEEEDSDLCHFRQLEADCSTPPPGKTGCITFNDQHGCCPKYQCDQDETKKSGLCPAEKEALKVMARYDVNNTNASTDSESESDDDSDSEDSKSRGNKKLKFSKQRKPHSEAMMMMDYVSVSLDDDRTSCIGDFNCPGNMKCCSDDMDVYIKEGHYLQRNGNPTDGFCVEPAKNETNNKEAAL